MMPPLAGLKIGTPAAARLVPTLPQKKFIFFTKKVDFTLFSVKLGEN
jgi:hypothetical protein